MGEQRLHFDRIAPQGYAALVGVETYLNGCGLDRGLMELVKLRASQINGCGFCLDLHSKTARRLGESEQRIFVLGGWRESMLYTPRERAALAWAEALTNLPAAGAPDHLYATMRSQFNDKEITDLSILVAQINSWNRVAMASGMLARRAA